MFSPFVRQYNLLFTLRYIFFYSKLSAVFDGGVTLLMLNRLRQYMKSN